MKRVISVDPGLSGAIAVFEDCKLIKVIDMPTKTIITKKAIKTLKLDSKGKKQQYKSGPNKGEDIYKIKTPAKTKKILNTHLISLYFLNADIVVIEQQHPRPGGAAMASFTTGINYGRLLAAAEVELKEVVIVSPSQWKTEMHIIMTKDEKLALGNDNPLITKTLKAKACALAAKLYPKNNFISDRRALLDGQAEAVLIGHNFINK